MRWLFLALLAAGCGSTAGSGGPNFDACGKKGVDPRCGKGCTVHADCGPTLYCRSNGVCNADCTPGGDECPGGGVCGLDGRCHAGSGGGGGGGGDGCPRVDVNASPVIPTIHMLLDQSGSMTESFMGPTRWDAMKSAITGGNGVVTVLQSKIRFGASLYTSHNGGAMCPILKDELPALDNHTKIKALLDANQPDDDTPTGEAVTALVSTLKQSAPNPDGGFVNAAILLATDGEPDTCSVPDPQTPAARTVSVNAVAAAYNEGFPTYVLSIGSDTAAQHLQDLANAGAGVAAGQPNAKFYKADAPDQLTAAFNQIAKGVRICRFKLSGMLDAADAPNGDVRLNGVPLGYMHPDGWQLVDPSTIEITGAACTMFKNTDNVSLTASFPCGTIIL